MSETILNADSQELLASLERGLSEATKGEYAAIHTTEQIRAAAALAAYVNGELLER